MWGMLWAVIKSGWKWIAIVAVALLAAFKFASDVVAGATFLDDLTVVLQRAKPVTDFFARQPEWIFYPLLVAILLTGIVAACASVAGEIVAVRARKPTQSPSAEGRSIYTSFESGSSPNMTLRDAASYIATKSTWSGDANDLIHEVRDKLALNEVSAWAATAPDKAIAELARWVWADATLDLMASTATIQGGMTLHRIKLNKELVMVVWPPRRSSVIGY
jgi:hypothetical protein